MSSEYRVLCLTHDPAIVIANEWRGPGGLAAALDAARKPTTCEATLEHRRCDLMVGRYSYPLVELACLGSGTTDAHRPVHRDPVWVDADWLRLLYHARRSGVAVVQDAAAGVGRSAGCWSVQRLARLRVELGVADPDELKPEVWRSTREWLADWPYVVIDPDGWREEGAPGLDEPISRWEFEQRMAASTVAPRDSPQGAERGNVFLQERPDVLP
jgi:hypothetical protein